MPQGKAAGHKEVATIEGMYTMEHLANEASIALCLIIKKFYLQLQYYILLQYEYINMKE